MPSIQEGSSYSCLVTVMFMWKMSSPMSWHQSQLPCSLRMEWEFVKPSPHWRSRSKSRNTGVADVTIIDGSALLSTIHWPADGTITDFIANVKTQLTSYLSYRMLRGPTFKQLCGEMSMGIFHPHGIQRNLVGKKTNLTGHCGQPIFQKIANLPQTTFWKWLGVAARPKTHVTPKSATVKYMVPHAQCSVDVLV